MLPKLLLRHLEGLDQSAVLVDDLLSCGQLL